MENNYKFNENKLTNKPSDIHANNLTSKEIIFKAFSEHSKNNLQKAEYLYKYYLDKGYKDPRVVTNLGVILKDSERKKEALELYLYWIDYYPEFAHLNFNLGDLYLLIGKYKQAIYYTKQSIKYNSNYSDSYKNLGILYDRQGQYVLAINNLNKSLKLQPSNIRASLALSNIYIRINQLDKAFSILKISEDNGFVNSDIYQKMAVLKLKSKYFAQAKVLINKSIKLNPNVPQTHIILSSINYQCKQFEKALNNLLQAVNLDPKLAVAHQNLGVVYKSLGLLEEAKISTLKSIKLNPNLIEAHIILSSIYINLGQIDKAEYSICRALEIDPNSAKSYYTLSRLSDFTKYPKYKKLLFNDKDLLSKSKEDLIYIYFARSNIHHLNKEFKQSSINLVKANELKLKLYNTDYTLLLNKAKSLLSIEFDQEIDLDNKDIGQEFIFIVGMPRSGSTLVESILSINKYSLPLGEVDFLEQAINSIDSQDILKRPLDLYYRYRKLVSKKSQENLIYIDKQLYNYAYLKYIVRYLPGAKIIYVYRNPLDNILSLYRANFEEGIRFSSSILDSLNYFIHLDNSFEQYLNFKSPQFYALNYDNLVKSPILEITSLIKWVGFEFSENYFSPESNSRIIRTASNIQARNPIYTSSTNNWYRYRKLLQPAYDTLIQYSKYRSLLED